MTIVGNFYSMSFIFDMNLNCWGLRLTQMFKNCIDFGAGPLDVPICLWSIRDLDHRWETKQRALELCL